MRTDRGNSHLGRGGGLTPPPDQTPPSDQTPPYQTPTPDQTPTHPQTDTHPRLDSPSGRSLERRYPLPRKELRRETPLWTEWHMPVKTLPSPLRYELQSVNTWTYVRVSEVSEWDIQWWSTKKYIWKHTWTTNIFDSERKILHIYIFGKRVNLLWNFFTVYFEWP